MNINTLEGPVATKPTDNNVKPHPAPELAPADYLGDLEEFDASEEQKLELLGILWSISRSMVELGFSTELREVICEQLFEGFDGISYPFASAVESRGRGNTELVSTIGKEGPDDE